MKVLLDECVDRRFAKELRGYQVKTVSEMGWKTIENGRLLQLAEKEFDVFITVDRNLSFQQNLPKFNIAVVILQAPTSRLADLQILVPKLLTILPTAKRGEATTVET